jgi:hypothetical protein
MLQSTADSGYPAPNELIFVDSGPEGSSSLMSPKSGDASLRQRLVNPSEKGASRDLRFSRFRFCALPGE